MNREKKIYKVTLMGTLVNLFLVVFKFISGTIGHSAAMIADAVHSLSDCVTDIVVLVFVKISARPEDDNHEYGHGKFETLATSIIGIILFFVGIGIFWSGCSSVISFIKGEPLRSPGMIALIAALVSVLLKEIMYRYTLINGKKLNSKVVIANAWHHRSDALSSIGTVVGIGGAILLGENWRILDPIAAMLVSVFIVKVSYDLVKPAVEELLECSLPKEVEDKICDIIATFPEVSLPHQLKTRRIGNCYSMDVHICMDGNVSLKEAHDKCTAIESKLKEAFGPNTYISIHMEPKTEEAEKLMKYKKINSTKVD